MSFDKSQLPKNWIKEFDPRTKHSFWVDTAATPPRAIWVHPYEDEQFLNEHPDVRARLAAAGSPPPSEHPPPAYSPRRHSFSGAGNHLTVQTDVNMPTSISHPGTPVEGPEARDGPDRRPRGFFGKMKDRAIGTREERAMARLEQEQMMQRLAEQRRVQVEEMRRQRLSTPVITTSSYGRRGRYPDSRSQYYAQPLYGPPASSPFGLNSRYGNAYDPYDRYDRFDRRRMGGGFGGGFGGGGFGGGGFGGGVGLPLLGGLAGGLLLGDILDGGIGGGGF